jgi:predicted CoA-substrate-specific enzyme activase
MGIDIGSSTSKAVIMKDGQKIVASQVIPVGTGTSGPKRALEGVLTRAGLSLADISYQVVTGYGRITYNGADGQISEITCHAKGVHFVLPTARTIIDIGAQDAKAIRLDERGMVSNFVMNEKCAAGTGRFLEVMARILECDVSDLASLSQKATAPVAISSTCTVFAESEVISQLAGGYSRENIAAGIHQSVAKRVASLAKRVGLAPAVVMTGGVAQNNGVVQAMAQELNIPVEVAPGAQITGALGAALLAYNKLTMNQQ